MKHWVPGVSTIAMLVATAAMAVPRQRSASDEDDDATVTLTVLEQQITGDVRSFCRVRIVVGAEDEPFADGDTISIRVYEDDLAGDDEVWSTSFDVSGDELANQRVDRTLDCSSNMGDDVGDMLEFYAEATVEKDECGFGCAFDRPETGNIPMQEVEDDEADDEDDASATAVRIALGLTADRINRDADYVALTLLDRSIVEIGVQHDPGAGRLDLTLFTPGGEPTGAAEAGPDGTFLVSAPLNPGEYRARVSPRDGNDFNFYDLTLRVLTAGCEPGSVEEEACGNCGSRRRTCTDGGMWEAFGACGDEGLCQPGEERMGPCGRCGMQVERCTDMCAFEAMPCMAEGQCAPGDVEVMICDGGGQQQRACGDTCLWGEFTVCDVNECTEGEMRDCYGGPPGTSGRGICRAGRQTCEEGAWAACEGEVGPAPEDCNDDLDNDCDTHVDDGDVDCGGESEAGDACRADDACPEGYDCLRPPADPGFSEGYCGRAGCADDCPEGSVCGSAFGRPYCLKDCRRDPDCRAGYRCADAGITGGGFACIPRCAADADCDDAELPTCDRATGLCVPSGAGGSGGAGPGGAGGGGAGPGGGPGGGGAGPGPGPGGGGSGPGGAGGIVPGGGGSGATGGSDEDDGAPSAEGCAGCDVSGGPIAGSLPFLLLLALRRRRP